LRFSVSVVKLICPPPLDRRLFLFELGFSATSVLPPPPPLFLPVVLASQNVRFPTLVGGSLSRFFVRLGYPILFSSTTSLSPFKQFLLKNPLILCRTLAFLLQSFWKTPFPCLSQQLTCPPAPVFYSGTILPLTLSDTACPVQSLPRG